MRRVPCAKHWLPDTSVGLQTHGAESNLLGKAGDEAPPNRRKNNKTTKGRNPTWGGEGLGALDAPVGVPKVQECGGSLVLGHGGQGLDQRPGSPAVSVEVHFISLIALMIRSDMGM